jgi:hypothetical protein
LPERFGKLPESFGKLPECFGKLPERFGKLPECFGKLPERFGKLPERFGKLPERFGKLPERLGMMQGWSLASTAAKAGAFAEQREYPETSGTPAKAKAKNRLPACTTISKNAYTAPQSGLHPRRKQKHKQAIPARHVDGTVIPPPNL